MSSKLIRQTRFSRGNRRTSRNVYTSPQKTAGTAKSAGGARNAGSARNVSRTDKKRRPVWKGLPSPARGTVQSVARVLLCVGAVCGLAVLLVLGLMQAYRFATTSDFFATQQVDVVGNVRISREMVQDLAGVHVGDNALAVSISEVERALLRTPWVEEVSVKRLLPGRFVIRLRERMPSFWVRKDGELYYADSKGAIIAPVETKNFLSLPTLTMEEGSEDEVTYLQSFIDDLKTGRFPVEFGAISSVHLSPGKGVEVYLEDRELRLSIASDDWNGNLKRLSITLGDLSRRNALGAVREIRAADGNVWVINNSAS